MNVQVVQEILRKRAQLLRRFDQPEQHGVGIDLEHPGGAADAQTFGQTRDYPHNEIVRRTLAMEYRAQGLQEVTATGQAEKLPPGTAMGMAIGTQVAPSHPTPVRTVRVGTEMGSGIDQTAASPCPDEAWWRDRGGWRSRVGAVFTGVAVRLVSE